MPIKKALGDARAAFQAQIVGMPCNKKSTVRSVGSFLFLVWKGLGYFCSSPTPSGVNLSHTHTHTHTHHSIPTSTTSPKTLGVNDFCVSVSLSLYVWGWVVCWCVFVTCGWITLNFCVRDFLLAGKPGAQLKNTRNRFNTNWNGLYVQ